MPDRMQHDAAPYLSWLTNLDIAELLVYEVSILVLLCVRLAF